ncbi:hypothetical protein Slin14017_G085390 [Septoria linicola]|nr:hypothetical protein Slin14017_G085390 [Septoria linicola]
MNLIATLLVTILPLSLARGDNKPGRFDYTCTSKDNCDITKVDAWLLQACQGIGGKELTDHGPWYTSTGDIIGSGAMCLCARGQTKAHSYTISGDYPPGTAELKFDSKAPYTCQSAN